MQLQSSGIIFSSSDLVNAEGFFVCSERTLCVSQPNRCSELYSSWVGSVEMIGGKTVWMVCKHLAPRNRMAHSTTIDSIMFYYLTVTDRIRGERCASQQFAWITNDTNYRWNSTSSDGWVDGRSYCVAGRYIVASSASTDTITMNYYNYYYLYYLSKGVNISNQTNVREERQQMPLVLCFFVWFCNKLRMQLKSNVSDVDHGRAQ